MTTQINAIPGTDVLTQFKDSLTHRVKVTKIACFEPSQADSQPSLSLFVAQTIEPFSNWLSLVFGLITKQFNHQTNCSPKYTIQSEV